jgi:D-cysteine desulfhydrase
MDDLSLQRWFPGVGRRLPRLVLTRLPTPVEAWERLARAAEIASLWVKCDDRSGPLYGGNKPRKLEFLLGEAQRRRRRVVLTFGGLGTHHGLATAICARTIGMRTVLVLVRQPVTDGVRRALLLDHAYGAELRLGGSVAGAVREGLRVYAQALRRGEWPAFIPTGGTSVRGTIGYVNAALELADQVRAGVLPEPDWVFTPVGSGGTLAGLVAGFQLAGLRTRVAGVLVTDILPPSARRLAGLANGALRRLRALDGAVPAAAVTADAFTIVTGYIGGGYGAPTEEGRAARRLVAECEGVELETTYTAKCVAALLRLAREKPYRGRTLLFWNTYSSVDPAAGIGGLPDYHALPTPFHRFFA